MTIEKITPEKIYKNANRLISDSNYKMQALKFKSIFNGEEKISHVKATNEILHYINK